MTWKEFKNHVEESGVTDDMEISFMDIVAGDEEVYIEKDKNHFYMC
jgi:hypothetical protein